MSDTQKQATLVLVRGLPGSGKSTIVSAASSLLPSGSWIILDPDEIDYDSDEYRTFCDDQKKQGVEEKLWPYRYLREQSREAIEQGKTIFWNQAFTNLDSFKKIIAKHIDMAGDAEVELRVLVVEVSVRPELARQRIAERIARGGHSVSDRKFETFVDDYHSFEQEDFTVISINGENDIDSNAALLRDVIVRS